MIGFGEIALILIVVLIMFGAGKLPNVMGDLGKGLRSFKEGMKEEPTKKDDNTPPSA
jgi:sec-independent protein translocase protein TatA